MDQVNMSEVTKGAFSMARIFDAEHGGEPLQIDAWLYFQDGAKRESNPLGVMMPPPRDPFKRAQRIKYFYERKLGRMVKDFQRLKRRLKESAKNWVEAENVPRVPKQHLLVDLRLMKKEIQQLKAKFQQAESNVETLIPVGVTFRREENEKRRSEMREYLKTLGSIEV